MPLIRNGQVVEDRYVRILDDADPGTASGLHMGDRKTRLLS